MTMSSVVLADDPRATILLYHGLTEGCPEDMHQKRKERFYDDMLYIKDNFDVISLSELQDIIEKRGSLSRNTVVITFDDGLKSDYTIAAPILEEFGFPATFFVVTNWRENEDYMNWEQIQELSQVTVDGEFLFTIGSHSHTHLYPGLQNLTGAALRSELEVSKNLIDQHIEPRLCEAFSLPYGTLPSDEESFLSLAEELGYKLIRTSRIENVDVATDDLLHLPCLPLYDFTEPGFIGAFHQNPLLPYLYFDPVQDVNISKSYVIEVPVTGIALYDDDDNLSNDGIVIEADFDDNELIKDLWVDYTAPQDEAVIHIEVNEGIYGRAKINLKVSAPGAYPSSGYFYANVNAPATILLYQGLT